MVVFIFLQSLLLGMIGIYIVLQDHTQSSVFFEHVHDINTDTGQAASIKTVSNSSKNPHERGGNLGFS